MQLQVCKAQFRLNMLRMENGLSNQIKRQTYKTSIFYSLQQPKLWFWAKIAIWCLIWLKSAFSSLYICRTQNCVFET